MIISYRTLNKDNMKNKDAIILCSTFNESIEDIFNFSKNIINQCLKIKEKYFISFVLVFEKSEKEKSKLLENLLDNFHEDFYQILVNKDGYGFPSCLNYGIKNSYSNFIFRIDTDDKLLENRLDNQLTTMLKKKIDLSYGDIIDEKGRLIRYPGTLLGIYLTIALGANPIPHPTVCVRRSKFYKYDVTVKKAEDFDLWIKFIINPSIKFQKLDTPLTQCNGERSLQKNKDNSKAQIEIRIKYIRKLFLILISLISGLITNIIRLILGTNLFIKLRRRF